MAAATVNNSHQGVLRYADESLRSDQPFMLEMIRQNWLSFSEVTTKFRSDEAFVTAAVAMHSRLLRGVGLCCNQGGGRKGGRQQ